METKIKTIDDFKTALKDKEKVTGYIWMVETIKDIPNPLIYNDEEIKLDNLNKTGNPHNKIQEAYLFDGVNSIHIKNIDGEEKVFIFNEDDFKNTDKYKMDENYIELPSYINKIPKLFFKQVYKLTPSISGDDFKTWQPIVRLFKGFTNQPTKKD